MIKYGTDLKEEKDLEEEAQLKKESGIIEDLELKNKNPNDKDIPESMKGPDWFSRNASILHKDYGRIKTERKP